MKKKYPIGTRIKYKGCCSQDVGKKGTIVGYGANKNIVWVVIPNSYIASELYKDSEHRWSTYIASLEVLTIPNQQLLFDFMYYE